MNAGNVVISVLVLIVALFLSFGLCALAVKLAELVGMNPIALLPGAVITLALYPILRKS